MSPARRALAGLALVPLAALAGWGAGAAAQPDRAPARPAPVCAPADAHGWAACTVPTPHQPARVMIRGYEDGSATVMLYDADGRRWERLR